MRGGRLRMGDQFGKCRSLAEPKVKAVTPKAECRPKAHQTLDAWMPLLAELDRLSDAEQRMKVSL